jgi:hypothetical protein
LLGPANVAITSAAGTFSAGDFAVAYPQTTDNFGDPIGACTPLPKIAFTAPSGFGGTVTFEYKFSAKADSHTAAVESGTTTVTVTITGGAVPVVVAAGVVEQLSETKVPAVDSEEAPKITYEGLRGANLMSTGGLGDAQLVSLLGNVNGPKTDLSDFSVSSVNNAFTNVWNGAGGALGDLKPALSVQPGNPLN